MLLRRSAAFTLLEILVVLALFGLVSAVLIGGGGELLKSVTRDDAESTALSAIAAARNSAVLTGRTLELRRDDQSRLLDWGEGRKEVAGDEDVRLLPPATVSAVLIGGRAQESALARVRFYADGTCDPFRLEISRGDASRVFTIDPWTCAVLAPDNGAKR
ncbi:MAG: GspH/FimT family pseudopilin [Lacunisphaera sp.]